MVTFTSEGPIQWNGSYRNDAAETSVCPASIVASKSLVSNLENSFALHSRVILIGLHRYVLYFNLSIQQ